MMFQWLSSLFAASMLIALGIVFLIFDPEFAEADDHSIRYMFMLARDIMTRRSEYKRGFFVWCLVVVMISYELVKSIWRVSNDRT